MLNEKEKKMLLEFLKNGAEFMFIPSSFLCEMIAADREETIGINSQLKLYILEKKQIRLSEDIIQKYCIGTIDPKNKWVLDNGDIKVIPDRFELKKIKGDRNGRG